MTGKMKTMCMPVMMFIALSAAITSPVHAREVQILIINWRGETQIEKRFRDGLKELGVEAIFTEFNADQNKESLQILANRKTAEILDIVIPYEILRMAKVYPEQ